MSENEKTTRNVVDYQACWEFLKNHLKRMIEVQKLIGNKTDDSLIQMMNGLEKQNTTQETVQ